MDNGQEGHIQRKPKKLNQDILYAGLFLVTSFVFMILTFEMLIWFWHSSLIEQMAEVLRSWV